LDSNIEEQAQRPLRVIIAGGGPVGLSFALMLKFSMKAKVSIVMYDGRWSKTDDGVAWKTSEQGNSRRQQTVTLQSRQYSKLPPFVLDQLFNEETHSTEMWPSGPDSPPDLGKPKNIRISRIEDVLLDLANKSEILLNPTNFSPENTDISDQHILAICDGPRSNTREFFAEKFGEADKSVYSIGDNHLEDTVLGRREAQGLVVGHQVSAGTHPRLQ
jgi:hypothetical protein